MKTTTETNSVLLGNAWRAFRYALALLWADIDSFARRRLLLAVTLVAATAITTAMAPIALKLTIDALSKGSAAGAYLPPALLILAYVFSQFLAKTFGEWRILVNGQGEQRLNRRLSRRLFAHIMSLPLRYHLDRKSGAIGQTLASGLNGYRSLLHNCLYTILPVTIEFVTITVVLAHFDRPVYVAILLITASAYLVTFTVGAAKIAKPARDVSAASIDSHALLTDTLLNYETVKYFNGESAVSRQYDAALARTESHWLALFRTRIGNGLTVAVIFATSIGTALFYAGNEVLRGTLSVGDFVLINTYLLRLAQPLEMLGNAVRDTSQSMAFLERMLETFRETPEGHGVQTLGMASDPTGALRFDRVTFGYRSGRTVLRNVSFAVPTGRTVGIVGASGSGKSSLVRLLFRLYELDEGQILLDEQSIASMALATLRETIAVVPQDTVLFNATIGENIGFGKPGCTLEEIESAARLAHLHEFIVGLPEGYDTVVGERGLKLSGGEKQRVAIARAALKKPRIYVFDEATSSLDTRTERRILHNLIEVSKGSTTLIVAHRLSTVVHADEILVLEGGQVVERGTHLELVQQDGSYAGLWRAQQSGARSNIHEASDTSREVALALSHSAS